MYYVSVQLTEGLGNRFFQVFAMLGYAAAHGHKPIFVREWILENKSHPGPKTILDFFPDIPVFEVKPDGGWTTYQEGPADAFTYKEIPKLYSHVKLSGCFQSQKYFPPVSMIPRLLMSCTSNNYPDLFPAAFLHIRRGDYLLPVCAHHNLDLIGYYRRALLCVGDGPILVCSDDIEWCKVNLPVLYGDVISQPQWMFLENVSDVDTLGLMIQCGRGAICANSTFSWWGAFWGCARDKYMPAVWGRPPLPPAVDLYPEGVIKLPV